MIRHIVIPSDEYPLSWPLGVPRTKSPIRSKFHPITYSKALNQVRSELAKIGALTIVASTNCVGDRVRNGDSGAAVYWTASSDVPGDGSFVPHVMTCDAWEYVTENLHAIALSLENLRALDRYGAVRREQAYAGFRALPPAPGETVVRPWREVLGVPTDGWAAMAPPDVILAYMKKRYQECMKDAHPDRGGDATLAADLGVAYEEAIAELEPPT